jgi:hypothetical protein
MLLSQMVSSELYMGAQKNYEPVLVTPLKPETVFPFLEMYMQDDISFQMKMACQTLKIVYGNTYHYHKSSRIQVKNMLHLPRCCMSISITIMKIAHTLKHTKLTTACCELNLRVSK